MVANEVRKLAEKSALAAREISKLINETVGRVDEGTRLAGEVEHAFERIVESVADTSASIAGIGGATQQQADATRDASRLRMWALRLASSLIFHWSMVRPLCDSENDTSGRASAMRRTTSAQYTSLSIC